MSLRPLCFDQLWERRGRIKLIQIKRFAYGPAMKRGRQGGPGRGASDISRRECLARRNTGVSGPYVFSRRRDKKTTLHRRDLLYTRFILDRG